MTKKLTKHGNSLALIIDRSVLDLLKIDDNTPLDITTDGEVLILNPIRDKDRQEKFKNALNSVNQNYKRVLKRLAE
jgi:antitoxin MazE